MEVCERTHHRVPDADKLWEEESRREGGMGLMMPFGVAVQITVDDIMLNDNMPDTKDKYAIIPPI